MEFRLVYEGQLKASNSGSRVTEKHDIRRQFHPQLKQLWETHQALEYYRTDPTWMGFEMASKDRFPSAIMIPNQLSYMQYLANNFARCGFSFVPLVHQRMNLICSLDILFLRRDKPGELLKGGGDLDNRIKVLFDALKVPGECSEVKSLPQEGETPFFCLLEDDKLVTDVSVTTDRLLIPLKDGESQNDVKLIIKVKVAATITDAFNLPLITT